MFGFQTLLAHILLVEGTQWQATDPVDCLPERVRLQLQGLQKNTWERLHSHRRLHRQARSQHLPKPPSHHNTLPLAPKMASQAHMVPAEIPLDTHLLHIPQTLPPSPHRHRHLLPIP